ncbi:AAA family ATPase [Candidatus Parcubacteria bacterium]|uniref:Uncharacterized protein n=1 Tax=Candidatus Magasanikbacteria bacterium CG10_big_fil_rev_8_21_14_0_10_38_6 TaxID=1974647 RepID=A0A2M6P181_9BACT|nr:AAA family ATPase [Candidatus Parcubacteria bacterium]PIR77461.1 MAG: hypothetical protein COU30_02300 [Candidatus Magasanikbacteria bacterium CG10_big_fil_rev_8_21_14_0_10_38_6]
MYLSKVFIKNYRSIKELEVSFKKGKNVIVGRNNSGKSNIVKAIDIVLGERSPDWDKSENISENDFHNGNTEEDIFIWCELTRDISSDTGEIEDLNFSEAGKTAYVKIQTPSQTDRYNGDDYIIEISDEFDTDQIEKLFYFELEEGQSKLDANEFKKMWIGGKSYCKKTLEQEFSNAKKIAFAFMAKKEDGKIIKHLSFFYTDDEANWKVGSNAGSLRNFFLQSAIIPAFRDTKDQLRINQWSWYGKLLKQYIDTENQDLKTAFGEVKKASDNVFKDLQSKICDKKTNIAFPGTTISFKFNPDTKQDIYKNALIYVDDGFNSELADKGSGIQSAVTISLFDFYIREVVHTSGSLLVIEEPELYLHPHGRRVISDRLNHFLDGGKNQVIVTTHSTEFIVPVSEELNIICVQKKNDGTVAKNTSFSTPKRKQILIRKQHAEMFFADAVILTEDAKYILEELAKEVHGASKDWLNENNISVLNVGGKTEFWKYAEVLQELEIPFFIIPDFDFLNNGISDYFTKLKFTQDRINELNTLKSTYSLTGFKNLANLQSTEQDGVKEYMSKLKDENIFLLSGELEDLYLEDKKPHYTKEQGVLETIATMIENGEKISDFIVADDFLDFFVFFREKMQILDNPSTLNLAEESDGIESESDITPEDLPF